MTASTSYTELSYGTITDVDPVMLRQDGAASSMIVSTVVGNAVVVDDRVLWCRIDKKIVVFSASQNTSDVNDDWEWSQDGTASVVDYGHKIYNRSGLDRDISLVVASCGDDGPVGADLIVNVRRDGTDVLFDDGLAIPDGEAAYTDTPDDTSWPQGSYLQVAVIQVGSTSPGSDLVIQVIGR